MNEKRRVGRPATDEQRRERNKITVYVTDHFYASARAISKIENDSMSDVIKTAILKYSLSLDKKYQGTARENAFHNQMIKELERLENKWQKKANRGGQDDT